MKKLLFLLGAIMLCMGLCACNKTTPCEHAYTIKKITAATCEEVGSKTLQCGLCGVTFTEEIPAAGHDYSDADCTTAKSCVLCGKTEGDPLGHDWKAASCTAPEICSTCGKENGEPLAHRYSAATCTDARRCTVCGNTDGESLGHSWIAATCTEPRTCSVCGYAEGEPSAHHWLDATCTEPRSCSVCGYAEGEPLAHHWLDATCTEPKTCIICGNTEGDAHGHDWADATCTTPQLCKACGQHNGKPLAHDYSRANCTAPQTCSACGKTVGEALGHTFDPQIKQEATCSANGIMQYTCRYCSASYDEEYTATVYTASQIYEMYRNTVGEITTYDEYNNKLAVGTCVIYNSNGELVTNYHVLVGAHSARVKIGSQYYTVHQVLAFDKFIDLAIIKIDADQFKPAVFCTDIHATGSTVFAIGSSYGLTLTLSQGIISYANRDLNGIEYIQHNAAISEGNSGGPLINEYGEVIGINTMSLIDGQALNFAIRISELDNISQSPMTLPEFCAHIVNNDAFVKMKNYIVSNGTFDEESNCYQLTRGYSVYVEKYTNYAYRVDRVACYFAEENIITLNAFKNGGEQVLAIMILPDISGAYTWNYLDMNGNVMAGLLEGGSNLLTYEYSNISDANIRSAAKDDVLDLILSILKNFNTNWKDAGVIAKDLDFMSF